MNTICNLESKNTYPLIFIKNVWKLKAYLTSAFNSVTGEL